MLSIKKSISICVLLVVAASMVAQVVSEQDMIESGLSTFPSVRLAELEVQKQQALERTAFNPAQPLFAIETPSDMGIAYEIEQEFQFPTVYGKRSKWLKSLTQVATSGADITKKEFVKDIRLAYLDAQLAQARIEFYSNQDSLWKDIASQSNRLFDGGEINRADLLFAQNQSGMMAYQLARAQTDFRNAAGLLKGYTDQNIGQVENLSPLSTDPSDDTDTFYFDDYLAASTRASETEMNVWKAQRLPGFVIGYLRTPERDTEFRYRYRLGLTIPIWQGQYGGQVEAGRVNTLIRQEDAELQRRQASIAKSQWGNTVSQTYQSIQWFEENGLPQMNQLITTYLRLYEGGEINYTLTLRNIVDALELQEQYLNAIQQHNEAVIQMQFLSGK